MKIINDFDAIKPIVDSEFAMIIAKTHACSTCKMITAHLQNTIKDFDALNVYEVYVDDLEEFRGEYVVFSVPTVLIFSEGKELLRESRFIDTNKINRLIDAYQS